MGIEKKLYNNEEIDRIVTNALNTMDLCYQSINELSDVITSLKIQRDCAFDMLKNALGVNVNIPVYPNQNIEKLEAITTSNNISSMRFKVGDRVKLKFATLTGYVPKYADGEWGEVKHVKDTGNLLVKLLGKEFEHKHYFTVNPSREVSEWVTKKEICAENIETKVEIGEVSEIREPLFNVNDVFMYKGDKYKIDSYVTDTVCGYLYFLLYMSEDGLYDTRKDKRVSEIELMKYVKVNEK